MKFGYRKPSIKKSISARTTGKINRTIKKSINPLYGKSGMGYINNPQKAVYNKIYNKTTTSVFDTSSKHSKNDFNNFTVAELKEILRSEGLKVSGTKQELIDRLKNNSVPKTQQDTYTFHVINDEKMICPQCNEIYIRRTSCPICHHDLVPLKNQQQSYDFEQTSSSSEFSENSKGCIGCLSLLFIAIIIYALFKI